MLLLKDLTVDLNKPLLVDVLDAAIIWILATGFWNDEAFWVDQEVWLD
jgi:hypothetical protein